jgi:hypothetical protein
MFRTNTLLAFFAPILGIISFCSCIFINTKILDIYLRVEGESFTYLDNAAFHMMIGCIFTSAALVLFTRWLSFFRGMMIAFPLYYFSYFGIVFLDVEETKVMLYFLIYGASAFMLMLLLLDKIIEFNQSRILDSLVLVILSAFVSYIIIIYLDIFAFDKGGRSVSFQYAAIANIVFLSIFIGVTLFFKNYKKERDLENYNFDIVIKNMEIEMIVGFCLFYVLIAIKNGYEVFSLSHYLQDISIANGNFIIFASVSISIIIEKFVIPNFNRHLVNIICLACLVISFLFLPILGSDVFTLRLVLLLIGILMSVIFMGTVDLLALKFEGINLACALAIYALASSIGYYCGYVTIDTSENTLGSEGFLISICFVLVGLLLYYLFLFKKLKLYR